MDATQDKAQKQVTPRESDPTKIDRNAPAGSSSSLGAESVRGGRPSTDDSVVEAMDEEFPPLQEADEVIQAGPKKVSEASTEKNKKK